MIWILALAVLLLAAVTAAGILLRDAAAVTDFTRKNLPPTPAYPFGTDWMGRDMLARTLAGLSLSIRLGILTAGASGLIALILGTAAATLGKKADAAVSWLIDLVMGVPHILLLLLISLALGRGFKGVVVGMALTHWTSLARLLRGEVYQLRTAPFLLAAEKLGHGRWELAWRYMTPHLLPQFITGVILLFPHAILHEASVTFLGFGLPPEQPAIGVILSESLQYLAMGKWWLALFPGLSLVGVVLLFAVIGEHVRGILDPGTVHQ